MGRYPKLSPDLCIRGLICAWCPPNPPLAPLPPCSGQCFAHTMHSQTSLPDNVMEALRGIPFGQRVIYDAMPFWSLKAAVNGEHCITQEGIHFFPSQCICSALPTQRHSSNATRFVKDQDLWPRTICREQRPMSGNDQGFHEIASRQQSQSPKLPWSMDSKAASPISARHLRLMWNNNKSEVAQPINGLARHAVCPQQFAFNFNGLMEWHEGTAVWPPRDASDHSPFKITSLWQEASLWPSP